MAENGKEEEEPKVEEEKDDRRKENVKCKKDKKFRSC